MILLEKFELNMLHAVCILIAVHDFPFTITWFQLSHPSRFWVQIPFNDLFSHIFSFLHGNSIETSWFSHIICQKPLTEEKSMQSCLDTCRSMLPPPVSRRAHLRSQTKKNSKQIRAVEVFDFKHYLTGPSGCTEAMGFRQSESMGSFGS